MNLFIWCNIAFGFYFLVAQQKPFVNSYFANVKVDSNILKALGPGILFASTAIGVSHLVQSTRSGAEFGFALVWAVIAANLFKYPFFEFGSRYASTTGTSIIDGYKKLGFWAILGYLLITLASMFFVVAAVAIVTSGFLDNLFGLGNVRLLTPILIGGCVIILILGRYRLLDSMIKVIGSVLLLSTLAAFVLTLDAGPQFERDLTPVLDYSDENTFLFLFALMGWMPTAVDLSAWNSLWTIERAKQTGVRPPLKATLFDFNFGYLTSAFLSLCFVTLGAFLLYGGETELPKQSAAFASVVVSMYTKVIGNWSYFIIAIAAFSIMFGTCIAVLDGYARSFDRTLSLIANFKSRKRNYPIILGILALISYAIIEATVFQADDPNGFRFLVDLATTISFLIAPIVAVLNLVLVTRKDFPLEGRPPGWLRILAYLGVIFLTVFSGIYIFAS